MRSEWMAASNFPRKVDKKCYSGENPRVFSSKVAQIMLCLACGGQRQPGRAKWCCLGADLPVKMRVKSISPSNSFRKMDKVMLLWRKSWSFSV